MSDPARIRAATQQGLVTQLRVDVHDLDTGEIARTMEDVVAPYEAARQRVQLIELVQESFPAAMIQSFADGAATFIAPGNLVVAAYAEVPPKRVPASVTAAGQERLFAA